MTVVFACSNPREASSPEKNPSSEAGTFKFAVGSIKGSQVSEETADSIIHSFQNDSLKNELIFKYTYELFKIGDSSKFRRWNKRSLRLSRSLGDTSKIAESHWDLANFYFVNDYRDSAYFFYNKAYENYEKVRADFHSGRMLLNMAIIQCNIKDYLGSEVTTVMAIERIKPLGKSKQLFMAYNNLGIIYNELSDFERSIFYHLKALQYAKESGEEDNRLSSLNNIGVAMKNNGDYEGALSFFQEALSVDSIYEKNPKIYAMLLDNLGHTKMLSGESLNLEDLFFQALRIRDSIDDEAGVIVNKIHLSEYFSKKGDIPKAKLYASEAKSMAGKTNNYRDLLNSMLLLSEIDKENAQKYLKSYIKINDSLQREEREVRNKFARIRFETDEYIAENEVLTEQRKWVIGGATGSLLILGLLFVIRSQKAHYKKLQLEQAQQRANEDIYNLLLEQENKIEEGRSKEKERISMELHDGVVGKIFGIRMILGSLVSKNDESSIKAQENYLQELQGIENEIREISHNLNTVVATTEVGFLVLVKKLLEEQEKITNIDFRLKTDESIHWDSINNRVKIHFFRIVQEAVQNIDKYAEADQANIAFQKQGNSVSLEISDNGNGFQVGKKHEGIGLRNIRSRVKDMKGEIKIRSDKKGTNITVKIPQELWKKS